MLSIDASVSAGDIIWHVPSDKYVAKTLYGVFVEFRQHYHAEPINYEFVSFDKKIIGSAGRYELWVIVRDPVMVRNRFIRANECYSSHEEANQAKLNLIAEDIRLLQQQRQKSIEAHQKFLNDMDELEHELLSKV